MKVSLNTIGYKLARVLKLKRKVVDTLMTEYDISRTQWQLLAWLIHIDTPCQQQELLKCLEIDKAHLARVLNQLEDKKLITRSTCSKDRRSLFIDLSPTGKKFIKTVEKVMLEEDKIVLQGLSDHEKASLHSLLDRVENNLLSFLRNIDEK